jgi:putative chitinase
MDSRLVRRVAPAARTEIAERIAVELPAYAIDSLARSAHWFGQMGHESGGFRFSQEIWRNTRAQRRYDFIRALGNVRPGDGYRFRGRGVIQLTGRFNYGMYGRLLDVNLIERPELAAEPYYSVKIACEYWRERKINPLADRDDALAITRRINGGTNGYRDRLARTIQARLILARAGMR